MSIAWGTLQWGDVPTWLGALTTLAALIAAAKVVRIELKRELRTEQLLEDDRATAARAAQADLVAAWQAPGARVQLMVLNGSPLPIYAVALAVLYQDDPMPMFTDVRSVLPPGEHAFDYPEELVAQLDHDDLGNYGDGMAFDAWDQLMISLHFRDTAGRKWIRHPDGWLQQVGQTSR